MFTRIMVPADGSAASKAALDTAIAVAQASGAPIAGLHVPPLRALMSHRIKAMSLGSQPQSVLTRSAIPVLVVTRAATS